MRNNKQQSINYKKGIFVLYLLSTILLYGCGKKDTLNTVVTSVKSNEASIVISEDTRNENKVKEESSTAKENSSPSETVIKQTIREWTELFGTFYDYHDCSAILTECTINNGTVEELFLLDITYTSEQSDLDEPEHYIADMKASYPNDNPNEITLWQDTSGGEGTSWSLFKECGPS